MDRFRTRSGWAPTGATIWCVAFAGLHLFWALGGSVGLTSSAGRELATRRPTTFVVFGLYGVSLLLLVAVAVIGAASTAESPRRRGAALVLVGVVGVILLLRGLVLEVVLAVNVAGVRAQVGPLEARWSLFLWDPWFALGGALFLATALQLRAGSTRRPACRPAKCAP